MTQPSTPAEILASWRYTPAEWRRFGNYEGRHWHKVIKQSKTWIVVIAVLTIIALAIVPLFGVLRIVPWDRYMIGAVFLILIFGGGFIGICVIVWLVQRSKLATLMADTGEVTITLAGINTSGTWHNWNYVDLLYNRFHDARTMTIAEGKPDQMELLEVRTIARTASGGTGTGIRDVISSCRVPIPHGRLSDADAIVARLLAEKERSLRS